MSEESLFCRRWNCQLLKWNWFQSWIFRFSVCFIRFLETSLQSFFRLLTVPLNVECKAWICIPFGMKSIISCNLIQLKCFCFASQFGHKSRRLNYYYVYCIAIGNQINWTKISLTEFLYLFFFLSFFDGLFLFSSFLSFNLQSFFLISIRWPKIESI